MERLKNLTAAENEILDYLDGITDGKMHTQEEAAAHFAVSCGRIRQVVGKSMRKQIPLGRSKPLKDFLR
ncbi:MAG: hypothetical protein E7467_01585 [Ruminococcaceae bacterium]|nr:hypothetical protein [Oscillospiraceae bacterium]